jgi:2-polyprenyl-3-methyl-5-hydroxy-6-metoxy-1,4-benzoquinol methylase
LRNEKIKVINNIKENNEPKPELEEYSAAEIEKWDREWLSYLLAEYQCQLASFREYPVTPPLPENPVDMINVAIINLSLGWGPPLSIYCHREAIMGKALMELGCGAGALGKCIARYCDSYLGVDCSRIALGIAKLVSPENCTYLHVNEHKELSEYFGTIDTVVSRFFWIHQNMEMARRALTFLRYFLKPQGRIYMDFFMLCQEKAVGHWKNTWITLSPHDPLAEATSATYEYTLEEITTLIEEFGFKIIHHQPHGETQRRYIVIMR